MRVPHLDLQDEALSVKNKSQIKIPLKFSALNCTVDIKEERLNVALTNKKVLTVPRPTNDLRYILAGITLAPIGTWMILVHQDIRKIKAGVIHDGSHSKTDDYTFIFIPYWSINLQFGFRVEATSVFVPHQSWLKL